eukprot:14863590-Ditylum_brightwellii.AAC.2
MSTGLDKKSPMVMGGRQRLPAAHSDNSVDSIMLVSSRRCAVNGRFRLSNALIPWHKFSAFR